MLRIIFVATVFDEVPEVFEYYASCPSWNINSGGSNCYGNTSSLKSLGNGVYESRIQWGPGYRVYLGQEGSKLVVLLGGGTKKKQQIDIDRAKELWKEYKTRKKKS